MKPVKPRKKIIYVDDVSYSLMALKDRIKEEYEVYPAQNVQKMFTLLKNVQPDLIILDVNMPGTNGHDALKMLKSDPEYSSIPVIFLTANSEKEEIVKEVKLGASAHVNKPFAVKTLTETIDRVIAEAGHLNAFR
ncbi:MAG: response regulator [Oscillospiraceae bacterium]|nr:response regulator [Oscillospiraceae bacterium]